MPGPPPVNAKGMSNSLRASAMRSKSDADLRQVSSELKEKLSRGADLDEILPDAFAAAREAAVRTLGQRPFDVQVLGGIVLHQGKIAEMATLVEAARCLYYKAAYEIDRKRTDPMLSAMAKWLAGEVAVKVTNEALQMHGGYGYIADYDVERFYRDAKIVEIYEGTKEIEKNTIARRILGKI